FELSFTLHYNLKIENRGEHHSSMMFPSNLSMFLFIIDGKQNIFLFIKRDIIVKRGELFIPKSENI
ncbi:MAG: hypothetical protein E6403_06690, partial [Enterococcus faecium]|nr:hypothetical protein [Enterococcus faecium]MDU6998345.1 hypothetical protein [Enterococcus faecium]